MGIRRGFKEAGTSGDYFTFHAGEELRAELRRLPPLPLRHGSRLPGTLLVRTCGTPAYRTPGNFSYELQVMPNYQNKGIGSILLGLAESVARR